MATTYNIATESAEKLAVRVNTKGGSSAISSRTAVLLKSPANVTVTPTTGTAGIVAGTYNWYVTRVVAGVESFGFSGQLVLAADASTIAFAVTDQTPNVLDPNAASSFNLYVIKSTDGNYVAGSTYQGFAYKQTVTGTTTLAWTSYTTTGTQYQNSPAVLSYPFATGNGAYGAPTWVDDVVVHNPNQTTGYSGYAITGELKQVRQIRTSIVESQLYSRTDTVTVTAGSGTVTNATNITWADFGKPVTGVGIPTNAYVGNVISKTSFVLSSVQGQNVPYYPGTTTAFNATANGNSITVTGSNVGPLPVQTSQYRTTRWQG